MLRGYRGVFVAAIGLVAAFLFYAGYNQLQSAQQQPYADYKYQPARDHLDPAPAKNPAVAAYPYEPYCDKPKNRDDADLCAQWAAVQAVSESNRLARIGLRVTYLEFAALVVTLIFTGWAAVAAGTAARAAASSLSLFVKAERGEVVASVQWAGHDTIVLKFINRGRSQAYVTHIDYRTYAEPPVGKIPVVLTRTQVYPLTLVSGDDAITEGPFGLTGGPVVWIAGGVLFLDVFNRMDYSPFAVVINRADQTIQAYTTNLDFSEWRRWAENANKGKKNLF